MKFELVHWERASNTGTDHLLMFHWANLLNFQRLTKFNVKLFVITIGIKLSFWSGALQISLKICCSHLFLNMLLITVLWFWEGFWSWMAYELCFHWDLLQYKAKNTLIKIVINRMIFEVVSFFPVSNIWKEWEVFFRFECLLYISMTKVYILNQVHTQYNLSASG